MLPMKKFGKKEVVDWKAISKGFEFMLNETRCEVVSNEMVSKVSRNGKARRERRLTVRVVGTEVTIEVSSTSFKNMSFGKRLAKAMGEAPKPKAQREPKAKRTYKKEAKRDLPCGLTEEQCKAYIKKYGYAFIVTPEGTFTAPEYETMKAKEEAKRQEEAEAELRRYEQERCDMVLDSIFETVLPMCQGWFEKFTNIDTFNNISALGEIIYETQQELMNRVLKTVTRLAKENKDDFHEINLAVWYLFYQDKYEAWVLNNWEKLWEITRQQWKQWRDENLGEGWEDRWKQTNEFSIESYETTEFDGEFEKCSQMKEVKAIYRRLAKQYHSDLGGSDEQFKQLVKAYEKALRNVDNNNEPTIEQLLDELLAEVEEELRGTLLLA